jgi:hypothetical protein
MYGSGDGSTTFNLPDYRGYFLRGWNNGAAIDPDAASRTNRGDGTTGDYVGTKESDQFAAHTHSINEAFSSNIYGWSTVSGTAAFGISGSVTSTSTGGTETRPKNINVIYCVSTATIGAVTTASTGSGSTNYIPQWTSTTALGNSPMTVSGSNIGIGTTAPSAKLEVAGTAGTDGIKFPDGTTQVTAAHSAYATVYRASNYTPAAANTWYDLPMTFEQSKSNITHSNSTNPERVQVISSGVYLITYSVNAMSNGTNGGTCTARLVKNNATEIAGTFASAAPAVGGYSVVISSSSAVSLTAADYVTVGVACNTAPNTYIGSNTTSAAPTTQSVASMTIVRLQ